MWLPTPTIHALEVRSSGGVARVTIDGGVWRPFFLLLFLLSFLSTLLKIHIALPKKKICPIILFFI
jgi:hypothetical protein